MVGVVHFAHGTATLVYNESGDEAHVESYDLPTTTRAGVAVTGSPPHETLSITLPWLTAADSRSHAARMFTTTLAATDDYDSYQAVADTRSYVGVGVAATPDHKNVRVIQVDPSGPAAGLLHPGDVITGVVGTTLSEQNLASLIGPAVIDEVAIVQPGARISLNVLRGGGAQRVSITTGSWTVAADAFQKAGLIAI
jgi:hypothetical protein